MKGIRRGNVSILAMMDHCGLRMSLWGPSWGLRCLSRVVVSRIIFRADVFKAKRPNRRHLRDVLTGFRPVEMGCIARQNDDAAGRIRLQLIGVELIAQADVEKIAGVSGERRGQKSKPLMASSVKGGGILGFCFFTRFGRLSQ